MGKIRKIPLSARYIKHPLQVVEPSKQKKNRQIFRAISADVSAALSDVSSLLITNRNRTRYRLLERT